MTTIQERPGATIAAPSTAPSTAPSATPSSPPVARPGVVRMALLLGAFVAIGPLTIDMYLPALPTIATQLETTSAAVQLTLTGTLVGLALGQLVLGPVSDALGRKRPLLAGTALHVLASLLVLVAPNLAVLGALRVLQGVGTAAGAVIAIAIVRDLYDGRAAATMLSRLFRARPGPHHRWGAAPLHLLAGDLRAARGVRDRHDRRGRPGAARDPAPGAAAEQRRAGHAAQLPRPLP
jgi:hypothetical protein